MILLVKYIEFQSQNQRYDGSLNLCYRCIKADVKNLQEKTLDGSFLAFIGVQDATKGVGRGLSKMDKQRGAVGNLGKNGRRGGNARDRKQVDDVAKQAGVDRREFGDFIEEMKGASGRGGADNFTFGELKKLA